MSGLVKSNRGATSRVEGKVVDSVLVLSKGCREKGTAGASQSAA